MADFLVQHLRIAVSAAGVTDFELGVDTDQVGSSGTPVGSLSSAFCYVTAGSALGGAGRVTTANVLLMNEDIGITAHLEDESTVRLTRTAAAELVAHQVYVTIIEYTGTAGGGNEFVVRGQGQTRLASGVSTVQTSVAGVLNSDRVAVWPGGIRCTGAGQTWAQALSTIEFNTSTDQVEIERNSTTNTAHVAWAAIEFTGRNWSVQQVSHGFALAGVVEEDAIVDVGSWAQSFILSTYRPQGAKHALSEIGYAVWPGATDRIRWQLNGDASAVTTLPPTYVAHAFIVTNDQVVVQHLNTIDGGETPFPGPDASQAVAITDHGELNARCLLGTTHTNGTGTSYPRAHFNHYLNTRSQAVWDRGRGGNITNWALQNVCFPEDEGSVAAGPVAGQVALPASHPEGRVPGTRGAVARARARGHTQIPSSVPFTKTPRTVPQ